jgi:O-antigen/teichoic acid export membrane protein
MATSDALAKGAGTGPGALESRVLAGTFWVLALRTAGRVATIARTLVLVRLLAPHDFGLVGVAAAVLSFADALSNTGVNLALLGRDRLDRPVLDTAWTIGVLRGAVVTSVLLVLAAPCAALLNAPDATGLIRVVAFAPLIDGLGNIGVIHYRRDLAYGPFYLLQAVGELVDLVVAVSLALWLGNAWALAWALIGLWAARAAVSYVVHPYRPRWRFERRTAGELLRFASHVTGAGVLTWALGGGVDAAVGGVFGVEALGYFRMAKLPAVVSIEITSALAWVSVAAFAKAAATPGALRALLVSVLTRALEAAVPIAIGGVLFAPELVRLAFGPRWEPIVPAVRVLAVFALCRAPLAVCAALFQGRGVPRRQVSASASELVILSALAAIAFEHGVTGAALAVTVAATASALMAMVYARGLANVGLRDVAGAAYRPLLASLPMFALRWATLGRIGAVWQLALVVIVASASYAIVVWWPERMRWRGMAASVLRAGADRRERRGGAA